MELVVIKYGGGLITLKSKTCQADLPNIKGVSEAIKEVVDRQRYHVIVVHGAGSFGHLKAKKWKLHLGKDSMINEPNLDSITRGPKTQEEAVVEVQEDMRELSSIVEQSLINSGLRCFKFPPHEWALNTGENFKGSLDPIFEAAKSGSIPILHGDIVKVEGEKVFGVLSGDDIATRLVLEADGGNYRVTNKLF